MLNYLLFRGLKMTPRQIGPSEVKMRTMVPAIAFFTTSMLAACGGGDAGVNGSVQTAQSAPRTEISGNPEDVHFEEIKDDNLVHRLNLPGWNYCKQNGFYSISGIQYVDSCGVSANLTDVVGPAPVGYGTGAIVARCSQIPFGSGTVSLAPTAGPGSADRRLHKLSCYQFVVPSSANVPIEVTLPPGVVGVAEVGFMGSTGSSHFKTAGVEGSGTLSMSPLLNPARYVLIVRTENTTGGQPMGVGIGVAAPLPNQNSLAQTAVSSRLGEYANGVTVTPGVSTAYTFFPQRDGLVKQNLTATFTANQSVKYQVMQQTGPATFVPYGSVTTLTLSQSGQKVAVSPTNPSNPTNTTTPYGLMVTVTSTNASAPANEPFKIRVSTVDNSFTGIGITNSETTSGYYPIQSGAVIQAINYVDLAAFVRDTAGFGVPNEKIKVTVKQNTGDATRDQVFDYTSDLTGSFARRFNFTPCSGVVFYENDYGPYGTPRDHWNGTHQKAQIVIQATDSVATKTFDFTRICSETYTGYR